MTAIKYKEDGVWKTLTMPSAVHIGTAAPDEDVKQIWVDTYAVTPPYGYVPPLVSALPAAPFDGQVVHYQNAAMATDGTVWAFRYRAASLSAYKWEFIGGPPLLDEYTVNETYATFGTNTWGSIGANDPTLTVPLAGIYIIEMYANISPSISCTVFMGFKIDATEPDAPTVLNCVYAYWPPGMQTGGQTMSLIRRPTLNAGSVLLMRYRQNSAGNLALSAGPKAMTVTPVRVS